MNKLLKYLGIITVVALILATINFAWNYRQHYGDWVKNQDISNVLAVYEPSAVMEENISRISAPELPDVTRYTLAALKAKAPEPVAGYLVVQNLEEGYRKMRSQLAFFGDKQDRLDPLSIVIANGVYTLDMIVEEVADPSLIEKNDQGEFVLYVPLALRAEASLIINKDETLLMSINTGAFLATFGDVFILEAAVKGWNTEENSPASYAAPEEFRPYITAWCGANLHMAGSKLAHLGYQASKSYGVSYTSCTDTLYRDDYGHLPGGTGWIIGNYFDDIYFGFYSYEANDVVILGNLYENNIVYAIDPHDRSQNLIIAYNTTRGVKQKHGIIISREVAYSYIFKNLTEDNNGTGIMIDRSSHDNVIAYNIAQRNKQDGLTFYESANNLSYQNTLIYNGKSGMRIRNSWNIISQNDVINYNDKSGVQLYSFYLTPARGATYRDLELDPYVQKAGASFIDTELIGNGNANFKLEDFNYINVFAPKLYQSPLYMFDGDVRGIDEVINADITDPKRGVKIINTQKKDQNLIRNSVEPR